ncbi:MAG: DNA topoisomerase III, partial [Bacteroidales bacterium]|nr:DNA topoisomerase III [Bacteroidales bacterium]
TRAAIIETLFKRRYIVKDKKNLVATPTGVELINLIYEESLKSAELTGKWEKKLREIEQKKYSAKQFLDELKVMVSEIVATVLRDNTNRRVAITEEVKKETAKKAKGEKKPAKPRQSKKKAEEKQDTPLVAEDSIIGKTCPVCGKGQIIKGKTAYGCSEWQSGCTFRLPFAGIKV